MGRRPSGGTTHAADWALSGADPKQWSWRAFAGSVAFGAATAGLGKYFAPEVGAAVKGVRGSWQGEGAARAAPRDLANPLNYRARVDPSKLGMNAGNVEVEYIGPRRVSQPAVAEGTPGLEGRGYRPQPGERSMTREQWKAESGRQRAAARIGRADQPLEQPNPNMAQHGHGHGDHGYQTTAQQQGDRIRTDITPSGRTAPTSKASHFTSPEAEAEALGRGRRILDNDLRRGAVPGTHPDPVTGQPTYVDPVTGQPTRYRVDPPTNRPGGYGEQIVKLKDPITGQVVRDPITNQPLTTVAPTPMLHARVIWEYVPSTGEWRPVTYFPDP